LRTQAGRRSGVSSAELGITQQRSAAAAAQQQQRSQELACHPQNHRNRTRSNFVFIHHLAKRPKPRKVLL
jgi:hypothetical protein